MSINEVVEKFQSLACVIDNRGTVVTAAEVVITQGLTVCHAVKPGEFIELVALAAFGAKVIESQHKRYTWLVAGSTVYLDASIIVFPSVSEAVANAESTLQPGEAFNVLEVEPARNTLEVLGGSLVKTVYSK